MQDLTPTSPADRGPVPDFTPVPRQHRSDGWTPERQRAFIAALAEVGSVTRAAKRVNMASEGAYALRRAPGADEFRAAWEAALNHGVQRLANIAIDRAMDGVPVPVFWRGEQVGERRRYNDRLLMFILRHHRPERYGRVAALPPAPGRTTDAKSTRASGRGMTPDQLSAARAAAWEAGRDERERHEAAIDRVVEDRFGRIRRGYKRAIAGDPARRAAWELLVGPTDWDDLDRQTPCGNLPDINFHRPDLIIPLALGNDDALYRLGDDGGLEDQEGE